MFNSDKGKLSVFKRIAANAEIYLATLLLIFYILLIATNTLLREIGLDRLPWGQEIVLGAFIWAVWLSAGYAIKTGEHLRFNGLISKSSDRVIYIAQLLESVLWVIFAVVVFTFSLETLSFYIDTGSNITGTTIPEYVRRAAIPVGMLVVIIRTLERSVLLTRSYRQGENMDKWVSSNE